MFMEKEQLLLNRLMEYSRTDMYPMHMPGHKRMAEDAALKDFPNPFAIDITEIDGFDNLHHPEDILKDSMEWAAQVYGADGTYYLVNGSSGGILSAVCAAVCPGGKILISRNCHKSVYHGVILNQLEVSYVYPQIIEDLGIQGGISAKDVETALEQCADVQAVLIVSPTYDGVVSDIGAIAQVVHSYGIPLIVDEAHGAHFAFCDEDGFGGMEAESCLVEIGQESERKNRLLASALTQGADVVIQSLHKTLPSLTQTAVLHIKGNRVDRYRLERYLQMFQSSSPSYVFMASMERCIYEMAEHGKEYLQEFFGRLERLRGGLREMKHLRLLDGVKGKWSVYGLDPSKLVVSCRSCVKVHADGHVEAMNGNMLAAWLRENYHLEMEMCGADYVVAILTFLDSEEGLERLCRALKEIDGELALKQPEERPSNDEIENKAWEVPVIRTKMASATEMERERVRLENCAGRVSAEFIYLYPPGIPIAAPGEELTETIVERILEYRRMGLPVQGMEDPNAEYLMVLVEEATVGKVMPEKSIIGSRKAGEF